MPDQETRNWRMDGTAMVPAYERPAVRLGEQPLAGGGQRGHDYATSPGGPPVPAGDKIAAASRPVMGTGVTNSSVPVPARPWDKARMGDEETVTTIETAHSVGGESGLSGAAVSN
jgi:hypothetical protein